MKRLIRYIICAAILFIAGRCSAPDYTTLDEGMECKAAKKMASKVCECQLECTEEEGQCW